MQYRSESRHFNFFFSISELLPKCSFFYIATHLFGVATQNATQNCVAFYFLFFAKHIMLTPSAQNRMLVFLLDSAFYSYGSGDNAFC